MEKEPLGRKTNLWGSGIVGAFFMLMIVWTTFTGDPSNSLHTSGQSWSFIGLFGVLVALGLSGLDILNRVTVK